MIRTITHSDYLANTNVLFCRLNILKRSNIIMYKSFIFGFKVFHAMLPITLNYFFNIKSYLHEMRSIINFAGTICKTNMRTFHSIMSYSKHIIKTMLTQHVLHVMKIYMYVIYLY